MILKIFVYKDKVGGEAVIRKMLFNSNDIVDTIMKQVINRFQLEEYVALFLECRPTISDNIIV